MNQHLISQINLMLKYNMTQFLTRQKKWKMNLKNLANSRSLMDLWFWCWRKKNIILIVLKNKPTKQLTVSTGDKAAGEGKIAKVQKLNSGYRICEAPVHSFGQTWMATMGPLQLWISLWSIPHHQFRPSLLELHLSCCTTTSTHQPLPSGQWQKGVL